MTLFTELHKKTQSLLKKAKARNVKLKMPRGGRYLYIHATISQKSIPFSDLEDLLVPVLYQGFVPEKMNDSLAARCAFEAFHCLVPISCLDTIRLAVIDPESGVSIGIDFDPKLDGMELGDRCLGLEQYVAATYAFEPKQYPVVNLYR
jgi:hypothetical protein